jgi:hypothetical protein
MFDKVQKTRTKKSHASVPLKGWAKWTWGWLGRVKEAEVRDTKYLGAEKEG